MSYTTRMEKTVLARLVREGLTQRAIGAKFGVGQATAKHYLKKYGLKTRKSGIRLPGTVFLCRCGETDPAAFRKHRHRTCRECMNSDTIRKTQKKKLKVVALMGGACVSCGFNRYACSLVLHHVDPTSKDPQAAYMRMWSWKRTLAEIKKCVLLCANCHQAVHARALTLSAIQLIPGPR